MHFLFLANIRESHWLAVLLKLDTSYLQPSGVPPKIKKAFIGLRFPLSKSNRAFKPSQILQTFMLMQYDIE